MKELRIIWISQKTQRRKINLCVGDVLENEVGELFWQDSSPLVIQVVPTEVLKCAGPRQQHVHRGRTCSILRRLLGVLLVFDGVSVCRICAERSTKQCGEKSDDPCEEHFKNGDARHILNFSTNVRCDVTASLR